MSKFSLPKLEYEYDHLEPYIDAKTMEIHHTKHHQAYVDNLNKLSEDAPADLPLHQMLSGLLIQDNGIGETDKLTLLKHGGGHYNHSLFWNYMCKNSNETNCSRFLTERIKADFGSLDVLKEIFDQESIKVFGSGWAWWIYDYNLKRSYVVSTKDQINPIMTNPNAVCLLGLDVWEHAYYLKYQNKRAEYVRNFWHVVDWKLISMIYDNIVLNNKPLALENDGHIVF
ncbi:superoxide dismutase [Mn/Fe]-like [Arctopsyche grandis]|uniref:superoxide dismutase [Mn/Fe]-like n=1 Tax=Arctopsyche grandis TaxID=121162 RepID=UPI00406D98B0